jgi:excisionase family DNA binding protein
VEERWKLRESTPAALAADPRRGGNPAPVLSRGDGGWPIGWQMATMDDRLRERAGLLHELWHANGSNGDGDRLADRLLRTREVALLFQVSERAVTDWARRGRLPSVRTPGGHRRYPAVAVRDLLEGAGLGPKG